MIESGDAAEAAMALVAALERQKQDLEHRLQRYRLALTAWALGRVPVGGECLLRHGRVIIRGEGAVIIHANIQT